MSHERLPRGASQLENAWDDLNLDVCPLFTQRHHLGQDEPAQTAGVCGDLSPAVPHEPAGSIVVWAFRLGSNGKWQTVPCWPPSFLAGPLARFVRRKELALQGCVFAAGAEIQGGVFQFQGVHVQVDVGAVWAFRPEAAWNSLIASKFLVVVDEHELRRLLSSLLIPVHRIVSQTLFTFQRFLISSFHD